MLARHHAHARSFARGNRKLLSGKYRPRVVEHLEGRRLLAAVTVTQFPLNVTGAGVKGLTLGGDGNLYAAETGVAPNVGRIVQLTPQGVASHFAVPPSVRPQFVAWGSDGNVWFTESPGNAIGRLNPTTGVVTEFPIPTANANPQQIIAASDGNLWFTEFSGNRIARMTTNGSFTEFSTLFAPPPNDNPFGLVDRGDGNIWYVANGSSRVGFQGMTTGVAGETSIPTANSGPYGIAAGPDGALWFTESATDKIGRIDNLFTAQKEYTLPPGTIPESIVLGPDNALYFTCFGTGRIGRIAVDSDIDNGGSPTITTYFNIPNMTNSAPVDLVVGPDKNIWFTESGMDEIGRLNLFADAEKPSALVTPHPVAGTNFSGEVAMFTSTLTDSVANDFVANIDWGDGSLPTVGTIQKGAAGKFFVSGTHTYATATTSGAPHTLTVTLDRRNGQPQYLVTTTTSIDVDGTTGPTLPPPTLSIGSATQNEGNSGTSSFSFTVTRTGDLSGPSSVLYTTADGSATSADNDYQPASNTLAFAAGESSKTITILVNGDTAYEPNEAFSVNLSAPVGATIAAASGIGTINNDDAQATLSIDNVSLNEGNSGTTTFSFTVTRGGNTSVGTSVDYASADGTATSAGVGADFTNVAGTLVFAAGETTKTIAVLVNGDHTLEANETFTVGLSGATGGAAISTPFGTATIIDDDAVPPPPPPPPASLSINNVSTTEGNSGLKNLTFTVTRAGDASGVSTVQYATAGGTASAGANDYIGQSGSLTFNAGETTKTITIQIKGDTSVEANETFKVNLSSPTGASLANTTGTGTIVNDDVAPVLPKMSIAGYSANETGSGLTAFTFKVTLDKPSSSTVSAHYATSNGTATSGSDYNSASGTVTFAAGQTVATITVYVKGDHTHESDETFFVNLSAATNATITVGKGTAIIKNDD